MKTATKLVLCVGLLALVFVPSAFATTTCLNVGYNLYISPSITCDTNDLQFSQFQFYPGGTSTPSAAQIGVTVVDVPGNSGFMFNPAFNVTAGQSTDAVIEFEVTGLNGTMISDLSIFFNGAFTAPGSTSFSETYCTQSFISGCNVFQITNPPPNLSQTINITPTSTLFITKDIIANGGLSGQASISAVENQFSTPDGGVTLMLLGGALVGLATLHRKFRA